VGGTVRQIIRRTLRGSVSQEGLILWGTRSTHVGGSVRTAPDASYVSLRRTQRGSVTNARVRVVGSMPTTDRRVLSLHARGHVLGGTPGGGHGTARSRCAARPRNGRRTETAADTRRLRRRWTAVQPTPVPIMPIPPITPTVPIIPIMCLQ
jgi:hypothetical protein